MKKLMLIKEIKVKLLVSGDKSCRVILESTSPEDIDDLIRLGSEVEVEIDFKVDTKKKIK